MSDDHCRYWKVKIGWRDDRGFCESSAEVVFEHATTALKAILACAEWRACPDPSVWTSVEVDLLDLEEPIYVRKKASLP